MGVYGNMLSSFPELFQSTDCWKAEIRPDGSWQKVGQIKNIQAVFMERMPGSLQSKLSGGITDLGNVSVIYMAKNDASIGDFLHHPESGAVYRITGTLDYCYSGGFIVYTVQLVQGDNTERKAKLPEAKKPIW